MSKKKRKLDAAVASIQQRWGLEAIKRGGPAKPLVEIPHIPTGFVALDKALVGIGGIPRSRLTEILGTPTSGATTLALKLIANAQAVRDEAAYIDLAHVFDADYASRCSVKLSKLLLVRPEHGHEALDIAHYLIASRGVGVLVFDSFTQLLNDFKSIESLTATLNRLLPSLSKSPCAPIFLTHFSVGATPSDQFLNDFALPHAAVRLLLKKERWIQKRRDIRGYEAQVKVLKNKLGLEGRSVSIAITFNGTVSGDAT